MDQKDIETQVKTKFLVHYRQEDAFQYVRIRPDGIGRVFSFECTSMEAGKRRFIATDLKKFWKYYQLMSESDRHFYEVIREDLPVRLYFDLEYPIESNPTVNPQKMVRDFLGLVCELLLEAFNEQLDVEKNFLILDSTTPSKFSAHVIVHMPDGKLFPGNVLLKPFIDLLCMTMEERSIGMIKNEDKDTYICDRSVYSKNRNFRLFLSSKVGKTSVLRMADYCRFYDTEGGIIKDSEIFQDALVTPYKHEKYELISMEKLKRIVEARIPVSTKLSNSTKFGLRNAVSAQSGEVKTLLSGNGASSPFKQLDSYIIDFIRNLSANPNAEIRVWNLIFLESIKKLRIQYQINNCRYCLNIGREHKKNNVYWTVDLLDKCFYQKCFDIDCRTFMSEYYRIPIKEWHNIDETYNQLSNRLLRKEGIENALLESLKVQDVRRESDSFYNTEIDEKLCENPDTLPTSPGQDSLYDLETDKFFNAFANTQMDQPILERLYDSETDRTLPSSNATTLHPEPPLFYDNKSVIEASAAVSNSRQSQSGFLGMAL